MNYVWEDLPERKNCFTVRNATMRDLRNRKIVQYYSANTRITVVQKCITENNTYYRTQSAAEHGLDWAFEASAFGLPNEAAPLENFTPPTLKLSSSTKSKKKQTTKPKKKSPKSGGVASPKRGFLARLLSRLK